MQIEHAIEALHYAYPGLSFLYFMSSTTLSICRRETVSQKRKDQCIRRDVLLALMILVIGTYVRFPSFYESKGAVSVSMRDGPAQVAILTVYRLPAP